MSNSWKLLLFGAELMLVFLIVSPAFAIGTSPTDGNELLKNCKEYTRIVDNGGTASKTEYVESGYCLGYVTGVIDDHFMWQISEGSPLDSTKHFCLPDGVTPDQAVRVLVKWLDDHPARLHERAIDLILNAFRDSFSCRR